MKECSVCSKSGVYHVTELTQGVAQVFHFCEAHFMEFIATADEAVQSTPQKGGAVWTLDESESVDDLLECPFCGMTFGEFRKHGRFGCAHDASIFRFMLRPILESLHGEVVHLGKVPRNAPEQHRKDLNLRKLQLELRTAVLQEQYEQAALIRDQIQALGEEQESAVQ